MEIDSRVDDAAIVVAETENRRAIERAEDNFRRRKSLRKIPGEILEDRREDSLRR